MLLRSQHCHGAAPSPLPHGARESAVPTWIVGGCRSLLRPTGPPTYTPRHSGFSSDTLKFKFSTVKQAPMSAMRTLATSGPTGGALRPGGRNGQLRSPGVPHPASNNVPSSRPSRRRHVPLPPPSVVADRMVVEASSSIEDAEVRYLIKRSTDVSKHFPTALGLDDFMQRLDVALWRYGFQNDNSIGEGGCGMKGARMPCVRRHDQQGPFKPAGRAMAAHAAARWQLHNQAARCSCSNGQPVP